MILCNPHNPLSGCYSKDALLDLLEFCQERDLHLIADEMYALTNLTLSEESHQFVSTLSLSEPFSPQGYVKVDPSRIHVVWSASKLFGMSGFKVVSQNPSTI